MKNAKTLSIIASAAYIIAFSLDIIIVRSFSLEFDNLLWWGFLISMAILLLMNNRSIAFAIISGINVLRILYNTLYNWLYDWRYNLSAMGILLDLCIIVSAIALFDLFLVGIKTTDGSKKLISGLWFMPGLLLSVCYLYDWFRLFSVQIYLWAQVFSQAFHILALLFSGLWLKTIMQETKDDAPAPLSNERIKDSIPTLGGADKLLQYKELLDSGIITQEEFDEKKRQVLGQ